MRKKVMAVVIAVLAFSLIAASAATLGVTSASGVGAGEDVVAACDPDGVDVDFTVEETSQDVVEVTEVTVSDIHGDCLLEDIFVTVYEGGTAAGTASGVVNAGTVTLTGFSADPELLDNVRVVIG